MKTIESSLYHILELPRKKEGETYPTLIMLHGRGADEHDLTGLADYFDERLMVISARAPYPFPYSGGFTWYEVLDVGKPDPVMFAESCKRLNQFIDDVKKNYPVDPSKTFLLGFSMGTIMSFAYTLTHPGMVRGVVANSGYIPEETELQFQWDKLHGTSFFVAHGTQDPVIPVSFGRRAKILLEQAKLDMEYHEYPMAHQISEEGLNDMAAWLSKKL